MRTEFKKYFIAIWIISLLFFGMELFYGFATELLIKSVNYLYVISLLFLLIEPNNLTEKFESENKLIKLKGYDIWGLLFILIGSLALLLFIGFKTSVIMIMAIITFIIAILIIIKYRDQITKTLIIKGLIIGGICSLAQYNYILSLLFIFITVPFFYISASILNEKFKFTQILFNSNYSSNILKSIFIGGLFALPMALSNLTDVIATNPFSWIKEFWQPILAFNFVVLEETWVRLFIMTFIYALVISKTEKKIIPVITAIIISSTIFGFTHYPHVDFYDCINISVLYGLPLGLLLYKRDFETVIGYHFMINIIGAISTYIMNVG